MSRSGRVVRVAARTAVYAAVAAAVAFALAWLVERWPVAGTVVSGLGVVAWAATLWRVIRAEDRVRTAAAIAATFVVSLLVVLALDALIGGGGRTGGPGDTAAGDAAGAAPATTIPATTIPATTIPATTAPATTAPATTTASATTAPVTTPPDPGPALTVSDPAGDCACPSGDLTAAGIDLVDGTLTVRLAGDPGDAVWVWSAAAPGEPRRLEGTELTPDGTGGALVVVDDPGPGPWAVVSGGGDRIPDLGYVDADARVVTVGDQGPVAARVEAAEAEIQSGVPALDDDAAALVASLLARRRLEGTTTVRRTLVDSPDRLVEITEAVAWPAWGQRVRVDGELTGAAVQDAGVEIVCTPSGLGASGLTCDDGTVPTTLDAALAVVRQPDALVLAALPDTTHGGEAARCVRVAAAPPGGPSVGDTCWRGDGVLVLLDRPGLDRVELLTHDPGPDPAILDVAEVSP